MEGFFLSIALTLTFILMGEFSYQGIFTTLHSSIDLLFFFFFDYTLLTETDFLV